MQKNNPKYCSRCPRPIEESRKGQYYCKSCNAEYMRDRRSRMFTITQISKAFNRDVMGKQDFMNRLSQ